MYGLRTLPLLAAVLFLALPSFATGNREVGSANNERGVAPGSRIELTGRVRRVGAEPFSTLVITDELSRDWHVLAEWEPVVAAYEQREVTVGAVVSRREMELADGTKLPPRWELAEVELIKPQPE
ncbi:MAG: hypothetical protein ACLFNT_09890 [Spirochaetales bacterium]